MLPEFRTSESLVGTIFFVFMNGDAAVIFFFVLSGYVLTYRFFQNPNTDYMMIAVAKRLPRLALLTTMATLASALIWLSGFYYFREAGTLSNSLWLKSFAFARLPDDFQASIFGALRQGAWRTFFSGESYYDSSLWTMMHEFHGSIIVFVAAPFFVFVLRNRLIWMFLALAILTFRYSEPYMIPFLFGMGIAYYHEKLVWFASSLATAFLLLLGIYLLGFEIPRHHYAIFERLFFWSPAIANGVDFKIIVQTIGATCVIIAVLQSQMAERIFDNRFGAILGRLSFPVYLVHVPVILSASSLVYIALFPSIGRDAIWAAASCTLILTVLISWPLAILDTRWVRFLNGKIGKLPELFAEKRVFSGFKSNEG